MALIKHFQQDGIRIGCMILVFGLGFGCPVRAVSHRSGFLAENCPSAGGFEPCSRGAPPLLSTSDVWYYPNHRPNDHDFLHTHPTTPEDESARTAGSLQIMIK